MPHTVPKDLPGVATGVTETSWGRIAPRLATILVTCWAHAEDTSADGSLMSNAKPAAMTTGEPWSRAGTVGTPGCWQGGPLPWARTHGAIVRDGVHAEGQLLAWVTQQLLALGEGFRDHLALLDPLGLVIALPRQPGDMACQSRDTGDTHPQASQLWAWGLSPSPSPPLDMDTKGWGLRWMGPLGLEVSHKQDMRHLQRGRGHPGPKLLPAVSPQLIELMDNTPGTTSNISGCWMGQEGSRGAGVTSPGSHLHQVRFQMSKVALVQTQVLMETPVPNMAKRLIFSTSRLGRFLISQSGMGLLVCVAMVTLASHLWGQTQDGGPKEGNSRQCPTALQSGGVVATLVGDMGLSTLQRPPAKRKVLGCHQHPTRPPVPIPLTGRIPESCAPTPPG